MRSAKILLFSLGLALIALPFFVFAQKPDAQPAQGQLLKRVITKTQKENFGAGGTVTVVGAPQGSVTVTGWNKNLVEVEANIELQAENEADLAQLAQVNTTVFDAGAVHINVLTAGVHDREYMKKNWKKFPKRLFGLPWKVDYIVHVPQYTDLEISLGDGALKISGVEGTMLLKGGQTDADLNLTGGNVSSTFGGGTVNIQVANRSWRGRTLDVNMVKGTVNVIMPANFNVDMDASIAQSGEILNTHPGLKEGDDDAEKFTAKKVMGKVGSGGAQFTITVGDGNIKLSAPQQQQ
jgi:hypothetical protein